LLGAAQGRSLVENASVGRLVAYTPKMYSMNPDNCVQFSSRECSTVFCSMIRGSMNGNLSKLILEDGTALSGQSFGADVSAAGEVVFNTGMVGYPETLTDPSYSGQILVLTYPLVGNYGVPDAKIFENGIIKHFESDRIHISGLIVSEICKKHSHPSAITSLDSWMKDSGIPGISGIDTRALTKRLRTHGTMLGKIETPTETTQFVNTNALNLVSKVSVKEVTKFEAEKPSEGNPTVVVVDCGCKASIIAALLKRGVNVVCVPYDYYFLNIDFDGLLISNGPGDPKMCSSTIKNVSRALAVGKPILGICLGHQILGLAVGADTYKLKFGHRGQNQPCLLNKEIWSRSNNRSNRCALTSQNHGYAIRRESIPGDWQVWFSNVNDDTVEGIKHSSKPYFSVQFHPEAAPGPIDTRWIFDEFVATVGKYRGSSI